MNEYLWIAWRGQDEEKGKIYWKFSWFTIKSYIFILCITVRSISHCLLMRALVSSESGISCFINRKSIWQEQYLWWGSLSKINLCVKNPSQPVWSCLNRTGASLTRTYIHIQIHKLFKTMESPCLHHFLPPSKPHCLFSSFTWLLPPPPTPMRLVLAKVSSC